MVTEYELWEFSRTLPKDTVKNIWYQSIFTDKRMIDSLRELYEQTGQGISGATQGDGVAVTASVSDGGDSESGNYRTAPEVVRGKERAQAEETEN